MMPSGPLADAYTAVDDAITELHDLETLVGLAASAHTTGKADEVRVVLDSVAQRLDRLGEYLHGTAHGALATAVGLSDDDEDHGDA